MDKISSLWQAALYQDKLLQSYRSFHFSFQSIFIAIGTCLSIAVLFFDNPLQIWLSYCLLVAICAHAWYLLVAMNKLIKARAEDVDYFHLQIIEYEKTLPKQDQVLTDFKVYQKFGRDQLNITEFTADFKITAAIRNQLIEKRTGHARQLLDDRINLGFQLVWLCIHIVAITRIISFYWIRM